MASLCVYKVVIESSDGRKTCQKNYIGPVTSDENAVRRALERFQEAGRRPRGFSGTSRPGQLGRRGGSIAA
jgi:hypothetical protein